jgi:branched-chain amino acid transport system ATP-binding protein
MLTATNTIPVRLKEVHAGYGRKEVLRNVSLSVEAGQIVAFIGPNGAGKSTILKTIAGSLRPWRGEIVLKGTDVSSWSVDRRSRFGLGYFMQGGRVFPNLTVYENLQVAASLQPPDGRFEGTAQVFETFPHLANEKNRRAGLLSGGTKQLLAFALVLCRRPEILLLDEPSAGLAPALANHLFQTLRKVCSTFDTCALLVEQNVRDALNIADRAYALRNGSICLETAHPREWLDSSLLEALFLAGPDGEPNSEGRTEHEDIYHKGEAI